MIDKELEEYLIGEVNTLHPQLIGEINDFQRGVGIGRLLAIDALFKKYGKALKIDYKLVNLND